MYEIKIGEITNEAKKNWHSAYKNDIQIIEDKICEYQCNMSTLEIASKCFHDEIQLDWGKFAWKGRKTEIKVFFKITGYNKKILDKIKPRKEYGIVYIDD